MTQIDVPDARSVSAGVDVQLTAVVPCFNEEEVLPEFHRRMTSACLAAKLQSYEILYVNDGSNDGTLRSMRDLQRQDPC